MTREINLISQRPILSPQEQKLEALVKMWLPLVCGIYALVLGGVLLISLYFTFRINRTEAKISQERTRIAGLEKNEGLYLSLKQRVRALTQIMDGHYPYTSLIEFFDQQEADSAKKTIVKSLKIDEAGAVSINLFIANTEELDWFINQLLQAAQTRFARVELVSIGYQTDGTFDISLEISGKKTQPKPI